MVNRIEGWEKRNVDFSKIHGDDSEAYKSLLGNLCLKEGMLVVDLMCGYGAVSREILEYCESEGIWINLFLLDAYSAQLERSRETLAPYRASGHSIVRVLEDVRKLSLPENSVDKAIVKMGLHEMKRDEQKSVLEKIIASLKPHGNLFVWESMGQTQEANTFFGRIVRMKDELAGYDSLVENRYFCCEDELLEMIKEAGGQRISKIYDGDFEYETWNYCKADFFGDCNKLDIWNRYIQATVPREIGKEIKLDSSGSLYRMVFRKKIFKVGKD